MSHPLKTISLIALMAMTVPLSAQETDAPADQGESSDAETTAPDAAQDETTGSTETGQTGEGTEDAPASGVPGLSMGEEVDEEGNRIGETYTEETFGDWEQRCVRTEDGSDPCQLYQLLRDSEGNAVAEMSVFPLPEDQQAVAGATIITPLETLLTRELTLTIDDGAARRYPFNFCLEQGCFARVGFTDAEVTALQRGANANVIIVPARAPDQEIAISASLSGFTDGYAAVIEANTD